MFIYEKWYPTPLRGRYGSTQQPRTALNRFATWMPTESSSSDSICSELLSVQETDSKRRAFARFFLEAGEPAEARSERSMPRYGTFPRKNSRWNGWRKGSNSRKCDQLNCRDSVATISASGKASGRLHHAPEILAGKPAAGGGVGRLSPGCEEDSSPRSLC